MSDKLDANSEREAFITEAMINNRVRYVGVSAFECCECGDPIPEGRRVAVPGVKLCVECAE